MPRITALTALTTPDRDADVLAIEDIDAGTTKKITPEDVLGYKEYIAYITQTSTSAPVIVSTLKDDFGATITPVRDGVGAYRLTFDSLNIGSAFFSWSQSAQASASEPTGGFFQLNSLYSIPLTDTDVYIWSRASNGALTDGILKGWLTVRL